MRIENPRAKLALIALGAIWSVVLTGAGLILLTLHTRLGGSSGGGWMTVPVGLTTGIGLASIAGGQFIFMALVADRLFPRASKWVVVGLEMVALIAFLIGLVLVIAWVNGWSNG